MQKLEENTSSPTTPYKERLSNFNSNIQKQCKTDKSDYIKINFGVANNNAGKVKRHTMNWKKIFASYSSNKGLISPTC